MLGGFSDTKKLSRSLTVMLRKKPSAKDLKILSAK